MEKEEHELLEFEAQHQLTSHNEKRMDRDVDDFTGQAQQRRQNKSNAAVQATTSHNDPITVFQKKKKKAPKTVFS